MVTIADIRADVQLKYLLDGKIEIQKGEELYVTLPVFHDGERPTTFRCGGRPKEGSPDEFIDVKLNGGIRAMLQPLGFYRGNLAVSVYCRTDEHDTVYRARVGDILGQLERYVKYRPYGRCFFQLNPQNVITPTVVDRTTGYSITTLNVEYTFNENAVVGFGLEEKERGGDLYGLLTEDGGLLLTED